MTLGGPRCSAESIARDESLRATASLVSSWLLIEQSGAWGPDALDDSRFPDEVGSQLKRRGAGVRILLIRRRTASDGPPTVFKAHSGGAQTRPVLVEERFTDPTDLLEIDFEALVRGDPGSGEIVDHPLYLVCTHGRHDICCADKGRPLYRALSAMRPEWTWEVSHLGGDRFAGNVLVLPRGDYFGRLEPGDAESFIARYESGRLDLAHYRGRSIHPRLVQAAEHFVRESDGLEHFDDLALAGYHRHDHDHASVSFQRSEGTTTVEVTAQLGEPLLLTCRAETPGIPVSYSLGLPSRARLG